MTASHHIIRIITIIDSGVLVTLDYVDYNWMEHVEVMGQNGRAIIKCA